jgi:CheY-like chemotaxis protein
MGLKPHVRFVPESQTSKPAVIIALTGLESDRDISAAYAAGISLFLTKTVSLKMIAKIMDDLDDVRLER